MTQITFSIASPYVTFETYSRMSGMTVSSIRKWVEDGRLPIMEKKNPTDKPFINLVALYQRANMESPYSV